MDTVIEPHHTSDPELHLLTDWSTAGAAVRWREAAIASAVAHVGLVILLAYLPSGVFKSPQRLQAALKVTPLVAPRFELTQPNPNKGKLSKNINMESLMPRPSIQAPRRRGNGRGRGDKRSRPRRRRLRRGPGGGWRRAGGLDAGPRQAAFPVD